MIEDWIKANPWAAVFIVAVIALTLVAGGVHRRRGWQGV